MGLYLKGGKSGGLKYLLSIKFLKKKCRLHYNNITFLQLYDIQAAHQTGNTVQQYQMLVAESVENNSVNSMHLHTLV